MAIAAVTNTAVQRRLPPLLSFELSEPTARRKPPTMFPMTPVVCPPPTVLRVGPWPFFSRFLWVELFFWYRFAILRSLSGIGACVNCFSRG